MTKNRHRIQGKKYPSLLRELNQLVITHIKLVIIMKVGRINYKIFT